MRKIILLSAFICVCLCLNAQVPDSTVSVTDTVLTVSTDSVAQSSQVLQSNSFGPGTLAKSILSQKTFSFNFFSIFRGILGMAVLIFIAWCISYNRRGINWGVVFKALALQLIIAVSVLLFPAVQGFFEILGKCFVDRESTRLNSSHQIISY